MLESKDFDVTPLDIFQAYYDCRKTKRNTWNALMFEERLERNLMDLYYELKDGSYRPGRSICFVIEHPKLREIWAADFRDRIVHHLLYNKISERFHNSFINDSYACIPQKGTHRAVDRAEKMVRSITQDYKYPAFYLKADISNFFVSIQKDILEKLILEKVTEVRYVDDILVLDREGGVLNDYIPKIDSFLRGNLKLHLHPDKVEINRVESGFKMLGFVCRPRARYLRNETIKRAKNKLKGMCKSKTDNIRIRATANSYFGICRQAKTYNVRKEIAKVIYPYGWLFDKELTKTYPPKVCS